jgi:hypothetical protein
MSVCVCEKERERIQICAPFIGNWFGIAADGSRVIVRGPRINKNTENQPISSHPFILRTGAVGFVGFVHGD